MHPTYHVELSDAPKNIRNSSGRFKRRVGFFLAAAFCVVVLNSIAQAQSAGDYRSAASGNWNSTATWETFNGTSWVAAVATPTSADGVITIRSPHVVTISAIGLSYDQVVVDAGGQVTVAGTITHTLANGTGTDLTINGTWLNQGGTWTVTGAAWTVGAGGTYIHNTTSGIATPLGQATLDAASNFIYRGSSTLTPAVSTANRTYGNLSFESTSGSWTVAASGTTPLTVNGDFTIGSGVTYGTTQTGIMTFAGNFTNNGTLTNGAGTQIYTFTGSGKTISGSGAISFETFIVNGGASITANSAVTVTGTLTLTNGKITTGANTLTLGSAATATGASSASYVIGNLKKTSVPSSFTFDVGTANGYSPVTLSSVSGPGDFTVSATQSAMPGLALPAKALQRYWKLTNGGLTSAVLQFKYLDADISGTEANYRIVKDTNSSGSGFSFPDAGADDVDDASNTATTLSAVSTFSNWSVAEPNAPTAVKLMKFAGTNNNGEVTLQWQSGYEARNLGYYVYREQNGRRTQITPSLIAGSALTTGLQTVVNGGLSYTWYDQIEQKAVGSRQKAEVGGQKAEGRGQKAEVGGQRAEVSVKGDVTYWLEDVDLNGARTLHGPIAPAIVYANPKGRPQRSALLNEVQGRGPVSGTTFRGWPAAFAGEPSQLRKPAAPSSEANITQREIAGMPGVKIAVSKPGWYRVSRAELLAAGMERDVVAPLLQLYTNGVEVAMSITGSGTLRDDGDYLEFYGQVVDSPTDAAQSYYLIQGRTPGKRILGRSDGRLVPPSGAQSYEYTIERKDRWVYYASLLNGDAENIFGHIVRTAPVNETLPVSHPDPATGQAQLEVSLVGVSLEEHHVLVSVNGQSVGTVDFGSSGHPTQSFNVPASLLVDGDNTVQFKALGGDTDTSLVDTLRLTYARQYAADNNAVPISLNSADTKRIDGFTDDQIRAMDITDPQQVTEVRIFVEEEKEGAHAVYVQVPDASAQNTRTLLVFAEGTEGHPDSIKSNEPSSWWSPPTGSDYVIITTGSLQANMEPLAALRRSQGMVVHVIDVEDLYDEFSFGRHTPQAIHDFLQTATSTWGRKPRYVLLAGDSSYDPKNYLGQGNTDYVPTKLLDTALMETASDDWLADFDNDGLADLALGRLPIRTPADADLMVTKIINYENTAPDPQRGALLVADRGFEGSSTAVQSLLPSSMPQQVINRSSADDTTIHNQIISSLNQGPRLVNFMGHGGNGTWTGALLLSIYDAPALTNNNRLSVFVMMTCMNGYFQNVYNDSLSEALMRTPGGAVAVWSSTGMTAPEGQNVIAQEFYRQLFSAQAPTVGEAARAAKRTTGDLDVRRTWMLFGDPAMRLR